MNPESELLTRRANKHRRGQILPMVAVSLLVMIGFTGLVIDVGQLYVAQRGLQASTNAAALAGGQCGPACTSQADINAATTYSSLTGDDNAQTYLPNATMVSGYPQVNCSATLEAAPFNIPCIPIASNGANANEVVVQQQVTVPLTFMGLFGFSSLKLYATATAAMRGSSAGPFNVAIIVDTTGSMNNTDSGSDGCNNETRITCALAGVRTLLTGLSPCSVSGCGTQSGGQSQYPLDSVALYTFPSLLASSVAGNDTGSGCSTSHTKATLEDYTQTLPTGVNAWTYQVVGFSSDYRLSDAATTLNPASALVQAVGTTTSNNCLTAIGGKGTFYAGVIAQAQSDLITQQSNVPHSQNVMIILSDGDANAACNSATVNGNVATCASGSDFTGNLTANGSYMSYFFMCQQAVKEAQVAAKAGTRIFTVAYGAEALGCASDNTQCTGNNTADCVPLVPVKKTPNTNYTPCYTMKNMALTALTAQFSPAQFFSDYKAAGSDSTCISAAQSATNLNTIFQEIAAELTVARLVPNGT
jgi:hypothetical protein